MILMGELSPQTVTVTVYSTNWCPDCRDAHNVFVKMGISYRSIDIDAVRGAAEEMIALAGGVRRVPTIVIDRGEIREVLVEPDLGLLSTTLTGLKDNPV